MVRLPPYAERLGMRLEGDGARSGIVMPFGPSVLGRPGFLHGGVIGGLLEVAAIVALRPAIDDAAVTIKPINLTVDYMRGGRDADTHAAATIRRLGSRIANVDVSAWQEDASRPIAAARLTFLLRRPAD
ncbi:uncharacterized domain 1-containing protein [Sphingomonas guangdongensis]|uniref:Uncharacterized domain 1-containing protein n=1 Tax=Sphingomonas guangdongensis TaxID=1141890 RepID=A0A285QDU8_9SPHN|nr:PaaI family thioesterase [Sphingomonas guangdongensis]SOB80016.1 uncharacterized domain 1-containing protein [Sphingomonas guangdongensis]